VTFFDRQFDDALWYSALKPGKERIKMRTWYSEKERERVRGLLKPYAINDDIRGGLDVLRSANIKTPSGSIPSTVFVRNQLVNLRAVLLSPKRKRRKKHRRPTNRQFSRTSIFANRIVVPRPESDTNLTAQEVIAIAKSGLNPKTKIKLLGLIDETKI